MGPADREVLGGRESLSFSVREAVDGEEVEVEEEAVVKGGEEA